MSIYIVSLYSYTNLHTLKFLGMSHEVPLKLTEIFQQRELILHCLYLLHKECITPAALYQLNLTHLAL